MIKKEKSLKINNNSNNSTPNTKDAIENKNNNPNRIKSVTFSNIESNNLIK